MGNRKPFYSHCAEHRFYREPTGAKWKWGKGLLYFITSSQVIFKSLMLCHQWIIKILKINQYLFWIYSGIKTCLDSKHTPVFSKCQKKKTMRRDNITNRILCIRYFSKQFTQIMSVNHTPQIHYTTFQVQLDPAFFMLLAVHKQHKQMTEQVLSSVFFLRCFHISCFV